MYTQAALTSVQCRCSQRKMCQIDRRTVVCYDLDETTCKLDETQTQITRLIMLRLRSIDHALRQSSLSRFSGNRENYQVSLSFYSGVKYFSQEGPNFSARLRKYRDGIARV